MEKIMQMAEGIDIGEMPSYDLMLSKTSKGQKRHLSTYDGEYTCFSKVGFEETVHLFKMIWVWYMAFITLVTLVVTHRQKFFFNLGMVF